MLPSAMPNFQLLFKEVICLQTCVQHHTSGLFTTSMQSDVEAAQKPAAVFPFKSHDVRKVDACGHYGDFTRRLCSS
jgi:hypothetical protein